MKKIVNHGILLVMLLFITTASANVYGQIGRRVDFWINSPYSLRMSEYLLPPGKYVLHRVIENDPNLFALHPENLTNEPIAMIRTARIEYASGNLPENTKVFVETNEASPENYPVVLG